MDRLLGARSGSTQSSADSICSYLYSILCKQMRPSKRQMEHIRVLLVAWHLTEVWVHQPVSVGQSSREEEVRVSSHNTVDWLNKLIALSLPSVQMLVLLHTKWTTLCNFKKVCMLVVCPTCSCCAAKHVCSLPCGHSSITGYIQLLLLILVESDFLILPMTNTCNTSVVHISQHEPWCHWTVSC